MSSDSGQELAPADLDRITRANQLTSPFLRLPAELRNTIYKLIFSNTVVEIYPSRSSLRFYDTYRCRDGLRMFREYSGPTAGLLHICRQIRAETHDMFFLTVTFDIRGLDPIDFIHDLSTEQAALVTSIIADENTTYNPRDGGSDVWLGRTQAKLVALNRALLIGFFTPAKLPDTVLDWTLNWVSGDRLRDGKVEVTTSLT